MLSEIRQQHKILVFRILKKFKLKEIESTMQFLETEGEKEMSKCWSEDSKFQLDRGVSF